MRGGRDDGFRRSQRFLRLQITLELDPGIRDVGADGRGGAVHVGSNLIGRHIFDIAQQNSHTLTFSESGEAAIEMQFALAAKEKLLRGLVGIGGVGEMIYIDERGSSRSAQEVDGCIGRDSGEPVGGLVKVLKLGLPLEGLDEGFLSQVLGIVHVADDAIDEEEDPAEVLLEKLGLGIRFGLDLRV